MAQGTNSVAFNRLQPLQGNDVGAIVEEHIRYWRNKKDSDDALKRAEEAQKAKFKANRNKEAFDLYEGLRPEENKGFLNAQIVETFEKNKPYYRQLVEQYRNGDLNAGLKLQEEKEKISQVVKLNKTYGEKAQELALQQSQGLGNEYLDNPVLKLRETFAKGNYRMNSDWSLDFYNPNTKGVDRMDTSALFNNDYLSSTLNKKADFTGNGSTIAKNLLDNNDGNSVVDSNTRIEGIRLVKSLFGQDDVEARSWYGNVRKQGLGDFKDKNGNPKPFGSLNEFDKNRLADLYYENNVVPNISETTVDRRLEDAIKNAQLRKLNKEDEDDITTDWSVATDEKGEKLMNPETNEDTVPNEDSTIFLAPSGVKIGTGNATLENLSFQRDGGKIKAIARKKTKVRETDDITGTSRIVDEIVENVTITNRTTLNEISKELEDNGLIGKGNLEGLNEKFDEIESNFSKEPTKSTSKPVYKGLDEDGNPIFE